MPPHQISLIIPTLDEGDRLPPFLAALDRSLASIPGGVELLVVDDGSAPGHRAACEAATRAMKNLAGRVISLDRHRGKGAAVRAGLLEAAGAWIGWVDADGAVPAREVARVLGMLDDDPADILLAARVRMLGRDVQRDPMRHVLGRAFAGWATGLLSLPVYDSQCGLKLLRRGTMRGLVEACREEGYLFDLELLVRGHRAGLNLREVPVDWADIPGNKVRPIRDGIRMAAGVLRLKRRLAKT